MKQYFLFVIGLFFALFAVAQNENLQKFYVGTFTSKGAEGIYLCSFNNATGDIKLEKTIKGIDNPSFLRLSPNKEFLYVGSRTTPAIEKSGGYVNAYKVDNKGNLQFLNKQNSNGLDPCHVDVSPNGKHVAIATYGGGTTSLYCVAEDGSLEPASQVIENKGAGADLDRQSRPHAHSIKFSPFDNSVFSADLGTDQLNIYRLENNRLEYGNQEFVKMTPGAGPRHFEFHPNGEVIYVINELNSTIATIKRKNTNWKVVQNISTLPKNYKGKSYCADIHISKDGKFLYGSNRGHNSIAVYEVNKKDQKLKLQGTVSVEGNWPRNFGITPDGNWMLVANEKSGDITVFKINRKTGLPTFTGNKIELPAPVCIEFL